MALIQCKNCNNEISDSAESCPRCSAPVPKTIAENEEQRTIPSLYDGGT